MLSSLEYQLEAHPITNNHQLLNFDIRSRDIEWHKLIVPLQRRYFHPGRYLGKDFNYMNEPIDLSAINRREVLICHDMMGNYLEDRHYDSSTKWDDYRFYHWSAVDYFCYFSHNYITIPPCGWTNAAHLHGVKVLGTFITEKGNGSHQLLEILESQNKIEQICDSLVKLCEHFCFEGWLVNIECDVPEHKIPFLISFVNTLRSYVTQRIRNGFVIWYDSVVYHGGVAWQNEINEKNVEFFKCCDGMLINYNWTDSHLQKTEQTVRNNFANNSKAFFGIDVFARGQVAKFQTNKTLARIVDKQFSVGIFAPGWTFEGLSNFGYPIRNLDGDELVNDAFLRRNDKFWSLLWQYFATHSYENLPFYTDFCLGSGNFTFSYGQKLNKKFFNLCRQSLQPSIPLQDFAERCYTDAVNGGSCLKITRVNSSFRIFCTEFQIRKSFIFGYAFKMNEHIGAFDMVLRLQTRPRQGNEYFLMCGNYPGNTAQITRNHIYLSPLDSRNYSYLSGLMSRENTPLKLPFNLSNDWNVRYYGFSCNENEGLSIKDIGVLFRKSDNYLISANDYPLLGAVYLQAFESIPIRHEIQNWFYATEQFVVANSMSV